jgi:sRNA-binding regulator protein Hfq
MATLEELARLKFTDPPLSAAEKRVVHHAVKGTEADCSDLGGGSDPEKPEKWPARNVRADLIRWLCVDREAREQIDPRGIQIRGARITGGLDLSFTNVLFPLGIFGCRLGRPLNLQWAKMPALSLEGSWTGAIFADGLKLEGSLFLRNGFHAEGEVVLLDAAVGGSLHADGGTFKNLKSDKNPDSTGYALSADGIEVTGGVFLSNGFSAEGEVRLLGATIGGNLEADGGTFKNSNGKALNADSVEVHSNVFMKDKFVADGTVGLVGAEIKGQLAVIDAWLDALNLESAHVTGSFFWGNIHKEPHLDFPNKEWKPFLDLTNAKVGVLVDQEASWPEKGRLLLMVSSMTG